MRKFPVAIVLLLAVVVGSSAYAAAPVKLLIRDKPVKTETAPLVTNGHVLVPLRAASEALGATVAWDAKSKTATVRKWSESVKLTVGKNKALLSGAYPGQSEEVSLDAPAQMASGRVYVPLRFLSQTFGYPVDWSNGTVSIRSPLGAADQAVLYNGSLESARKLAMKLALGRLHSERPALLPKHDSEYYSNTFLFPEGEALRFYLIQGDVVSWIEMTEDGPVVTWQARVANDSDAFSLFLKKKWTEAQGTAPALKTAFYAYSSGMMGDSNDEESGVVDLQGQYVQSGYTHWVAGGVTMQEGQVVYRLDGEKRKETVKLPPPSTSNADVFKPGVTIDFPKGADAEEETVLQLVKGSISALAAKDKAAFRATLSSADSDYFDFLLEPALQFKFTELIQIAPYDAETGRKNIVIGFDKSENGKVQHSNYTFTARKNKDGKWGIANID
ncbi:copper amine oxidase N-terminal domain-containing protein [Cohnella nanjingensis]|uniref:Copper amine oxidase N-terminal domain-containing protein n=1 Tax=Cohnella nanjingensis TaxID=1387779 RepID=A0A7X0VFH0_9BACL|nr:copper amine oxidase N-terminal domain-containing protein [Cohnella nanjingensis]MBB6672055.1 copper amine oxidase N-terminal domain-containing protein [Cohnella nanjingensis]